MTSARRLAAAFCTVGFGAGVGHAILGRVARGVPWFCLDTIGWGALVYLAHAGWGHGFIGLIPVLGVLRLLATIDAWRVSRAPAQPPSVARVIVGLAAYVVFVLVMATPIKHGFVEAFRLPSASMAPTAMAGDHVFIAKDRRAPRRGDIVVYRNDKGLAYIKRVLAVAGDTIAFIDGEPVLNGAALPRHPVAGTCTIDDPDPDQGWTAHACTAARESLDGRTYTIVHTAPPAAAHPSVTVPPGSVYVVGDNRDNSHDSRFTGPVPLDQVEGTALFIYFSVGPHGVRWDRVGLAL